ncbi:MAG TPA: hypothetical protein VG710_05855 [Opitutus sp.]|nr:hypothetical protein [Opitutus sp.]
MKMPLSKPRAVVAAIAAVLLLTLSVRAQHASVQIPSAERVAQIKSWLVAGPFGPGFPASDRARWTNAAEKLPVPELLAAAAQAARAPVPDAPDNLYLEYSRDGNRTHYQSAIGRRRGRLALFAWAEAVEGQGRFLPALAREMSAILDEKTWVLPAHDGHLTNFEGRTTEVDLGTAMTGWSLGIADYWHGSALPPALHARLEAELRRRVIDPYLALLHGAPRTPGWWWVTGTNNWNAVCHAGVVGTTLALDGPNAERAEILAAAERNVRAYTEHGLSDDGYCDEGIGYWDYGFGHLALLSEVMAGATRGNLRLISGRKLEAVARYPEHLEIIAGVYPSFSDGSADETPSDFVRALAEHQFDPTIGPPAAPVTVGMLRGGELYEAAYRALLPGSTPVPPAATPTSARFWFGDGQVLVSRANPDFGAAIKGANNGESHNHNDAGTFVVAHGHSAPIIDPGGEVYTARTFGPHRYDSKVLNSYGHPVPLVAGQLQGTGAKFAARVLATDFTAARDRIVLDLTHAYAVPSLVSLVREFSVVRTPAPAVVIFDRVTFKTPETFGTALITFGPWQQVAADVLEIGAGADAVQVQVSSEGGPIAISPEVIEEDLPSHKKPVRLGLNFAHPVKQASISIRITPVK